MIVIIKQRLRSPINPGQVLEIGSEFNAPEAWAIRRIKDGSVILKESNKKAAKNGDSV